jgi:hypothetical protein
MTGLAYRVLRLFVDSVWLAAAAAACAVAVAGAILAGAPRGMAACALLAGLAGVLAVSVRRAVRAGGHGSGR